MRAKLSSISTLIVLCLQERSCNGFPILIAAYMYNSLRSFEVKFIPEDLTLLQILGNKVARAGVAWHPEGLDLAAAGPSNDIVLYERHNWQESSHLDGEHSDTVSCLAFSPNGKSQ